MQLTNRSKTVERKPMTFWEKLYLPAIAKGMGITFSHMFKKKPTVNYPEKRVRSLLCSVVFRY
jgi:NADH-quinone oxidoreductase subunit I